MPRVLFAAALLVVAAACSGGGPSTTPAATPAVTLEISATNNVFDKSAMAVPAGVVYAIAFDNRDPVPHNVSVPTGPAGSSGEIFSGPGQRTYVFPALTAGSYTFQCDVHPEMNGTLTAE